MSREEGEGRGKRLKRGRLGGLFFSNFWFMFSDVLGCNRESISYRRYINSKSTSNVYMYDKHAF